MIRLWRFGARRHDDERGILDDPALARRVRLSGAALLWERLWPALWPATAIAGVFVVVSLFGLWMLLPGWPHALILLGFAIGFAVALRRVVDAVRLPDLDSSIDRLERTGGVPHRPLTAVLDSPAGGARDPAARALWRAHRWRMGRAVRGLRVAPPAAGLARQDPWALRAVLVLLLALGFAVAGDRTLTRLAGAVEPDLGPPTGAGPGELTAWITPPEYTGLAPVFLTSGDGTEATAAPIPVATGSVLVARVYGGGSAPALRLDAEPMPFASVDGVDFEVQLSFEVTVPETGPRRVEVVQGGATLGAWSVRVLPDRPPQLTLPAPPEQTSRAILRLEYKAGDDYGLEAVGAEIFLIDDPEAAPIALDLPLPGFNPTAAHESSYHDLTPHPWAGMPVAMTFTARDHARQTSEPVHVTMTLPARAFEHPIARAIIEQRRVLALAPERVEAVRRALVRIAERPDQFGHDTVVYLSLRTAYARLRYRHDEDTRASTLDLLWDVALRIEDGSLSLAERDLRVAEEALREALDQGASNEEIEALTDQLEAALEKYLDLLEQKAAEQQGEQTPRQARPRGDTRSREDIEQLLEQMRNMATTGARDAAQELLSRMQELLENLRLGQSRPNQAGMDREPMLSRLQDVMRDQQQLLDDVFDEMTSRGENRPLDPGDPEDGEQGADRQEALRRALGDVMREIAEAGDEIPDALGKAERLMKSSRDELRRGRPDRSVDPQAQALEQLRQGAAKLKNQWAQQQGSQPGEGGLPQSYDDIRDPLGRMPPGKEGNPSGFVNIPKEFDIQRSREILDELYRRAGQRDRPESEREYIDRLLRWY